MNFQGYYGNTKLDEGAQKLGHKRGRTSGDQRGAGGGTPAGVSLTWCSLCVLWVCALNSGKVASYIGYPLPLLPKAFYNLPKTPLLQLCKHLGLPHTGADSLIEILRGLVMHCFPGMKDRAVMAILHQRTQYGDPLQDMLEVIEKHDLATDDDQKDLQKVKENRTHTKDTVESFTRDFVAYEQMTSKKQKPLKSRSGKAFPKQLPPLTDLDSWAATEKVREWLPPDDSTVFCDKANGRWQLFWPSTRLSRSAAFAKYGFAGAAHRCVMQAWQAWTRCGGPSPPFALEVPM